MCDTSVVGMYAPPSNGPDATPSTNNDGDQQRRRKRARMADCHRGGWGDNDLTTIVESLSDGQQAMRDAEGKNE